MVGSEHSLGKFRPDIRLICRRPTLQLFMIKHSRHKRVLNRSLFPRKKPR